MPAPPASEPLLVGWREWGALPDLGLPTLQIKMDTGARTTALHAVDIEPFDEDGQPRVRFVVQPFTKRPEVRVACVADVVDRRVVTDTGGRSERRIFIRTTLALGGQTWPIEVNLTNRKGRRYRMLLGRTAMEGRLHIDAGRSYVLGRPPAASSR